MIVVGFALIVAGDAATTFSILRGPGRVVDPKRHPTRLDGGGHVQPHDPWHKPTG